MKCYKYISSRGPEMWLKRPQKRGAEMEKSPPERCRPKIRNTTSVERRATPTRSSGNARSTKPCTTKRPATPRAATSCPGSTHNYGRHGPTVLASRFQTKIYTKRDHKTQRSDRRRRRPQTRHTTKRATKKTEVEHPVRSSGQKTTPTGSTLVVGWAASYVALTAQYDS